LVVAAVESLVVEGFAAGACWARAVPVSRSPAARRVVVAVSFLFKRGVFILRIRTQSGKYGKVKVERRQGRRI
jgi:hypothetical protein